MATQRTVQFRYLTQCSVQECIPLVLRKLTSVSNLFRFAGAERKALGLNFLDRVER